MGQKRKWFQVTDFQPSSPRACTVLSTAFRSAGRFAVPLPLNRFPRPEDQCFPAHRSLLALLPDGTGSSDRPFPRLQQRRLSAPPFQGQKSWPAPSLPRLQASSPVRPPAPPPLPVRPGRGGFLASGPLRLRPQAPRTASATSAPLSGYYPRPDRSVQSLPLPYGPPSEFARFPLAPRCPSPF